ncbi:MAG: 6-carboxytetrahydropterin synthase QueD [Halobacteria archaeon]|nr:6-carboxytetrahydropterin synthase QueD [Halobacteria archaeon]
MYKVTKEIDFCYGHRLQNYDGKCQHVHGHNGIAEIELESEELDERGMVYDFSDIKRDVKAWIDDNLDHKMLVREDDPFIEYLEDMGEPYYVMEKNPTAEAIAELIYEHTAEQGYPVTAVRLWETETSFATYEP